MARYRDRRINPSVDDIARIRLLKSRPPGRSEYLEIEQVTSHQGPIGHGVQGVLYAIAFEALQAKPALRRHCTSPACEFARGNLGEKSRVDPSAEERPPNRVHGIAGAVAPGTEIERNPEVPRKPHFRP